MTGTHYYRRYTQAASILGIAVGVIVLAGWFLGIAAVKSVLPGLATMKFNTALCFCLSGVALWYLHRPGTSQGKKYAAIACAAVSGLVALATLCEYWWDVNFGIDQLFVSDPDTAPENFPGRMSAATALCFVLLSTSQLFLSLPGKNYLPASQFTALAATLGGLIGIEGYLMGTSALYSFIWFSSMAVHTSLLFILSGAGTLAARPDAGIMTTLSSERMGGQMARRLLTVAILLPTLMGWLLAFGSKTGHYESELTTAIFAAVTMLAFVMLIWCSARYLNRVHNELIQRNRELEKAKEASANLAAIVTSSDDAIVSTDLNGIVTSWNQGAEKIFGYQASEITGQPVTRLIPDDRFDEEDKIRERIRKGKKTSHYETVRRRKDGRLIEVSVTISPIRDEKGVLTGASKIARDITEERLVESQLQTSQREVGNLRSALDEHAIVAITDPKGKITYVNDKFCAISKYSREELLGQDHRIINSGYHPKEFIENLWKTITAGKVWQGEIKNRAKDGSIYWVDTTIVPFLDKNGIPRQYVAIRADITERKQAMENRIRTIIEASTDAVIVTDREGVVRFANPAAEIVLERPLEQIISHPLGFTLLKGQTMEKDFTHKDGAAGVAEMRVVETVWDDQPAYLATLRDITERVRTQKALKESEENLRGYTKELEQKTRDLEEVLYVTSHDLRSPLINIEGHSQELRLLLEELEPLAEQAKEKSGRNIENILKDELPGSVEFINSGVRKMNHLIEGLIKLGRIGQTDLDIEPISGKSLFEHVLDSMSFSLKKHEVEITIEELPACLGDLFQLNRVFTNLIDNAIKYRQPERRCKISITGYQEGDWSVYCVEDNGMGVPLEEQEQVFKIFHRVHTEGTEGEGLGLSIVQKLVELHKGEIALRSEGAGKGSTVIVKLPCAEATQSDASGLPVNAL